MIFSSMEKPLLQVGKLYEMLDPRQIKGYIPAFITIDKMEYLKQKTIVLLIEKNEYMGFEIENYVKILLEDKPYIIHSMYLRELAD